MPITHERRTPAFNPVAVALWALIFVAYLLLSGCQEEPKEPAASPESASGPATAAEESNAEALFQTHCASCHGEDGSGGAVAPAMSHMEFKYGSTKEAIMATISEGKPQGMPAFGTQLEDQQISILADYVLSLTEQGT